MWLWFTAEIMFLRKPCGRCWKAKTENCEWQSIDYCCGKEGKAGEIDYIKFKSGANSD